MYLERIEQVQKKTELPAIISIPLVEPPEEREQRIAQQKLLDEDWKQACSEHRNEENRRVAVKGMPTRNGDLTSACRSRHQEKLPETVRREV